MSTPSGGPVRAMTRAEADRLLADTSSKPHEGRVYDYYLGGKKNYAVDREFAKRQIERIPDLPWAAQQNRGFLRRAVEYMVGEGIRQFIDIGSGLPTQGNVHQVAQKAAPDQCRVIYIDHDPIASAHSYLLLEAANDLERNVTINGDLLNYEDLWGAIHSTELIDPAKPVGLLFAAVLHSLPDDLNPHHPVAFFRKRACAGSIMAISHASTEDMSPAAKSRLSAVLKDYDNTTSRAVSRTRDEVREFFGDWMLLDPPGIVWTPDWHVPGTETEKPVDSTRAQAVAGVARKP